ncbi:hypothetical protein CCYA_CCYA09G2595 [Cyanidiococcus yangmingshanensis]|nr:hypothetical protein CCYA_CCYA09G2595 [Cyanidiococcus yangmingshanensis]
MTGACWRRQSLRRSWTLFREWPQRCTLPCRGRRQKSQDVRERAVKPNPREGPCNTSGNASETASVSDAGAAAEFSAARQVERQGELALLGGGFARIRHQHRSGKLTARERLHILLDRGSFQELDRLVRSRDSPAAQGRTTARGSHVPGDGVVTGHGFVHGRTVFVYSQDFTVAGGSLSEANAGKICKVMDLAIQAGAPLIGICDSGGARIQEGVRSLAGYAEVFKRNVLASGFIPQLSLILGPCAGGAVYSPALTDFVLMNRQHAHMFVTGPEVTSAALGERATRDELGGAAIHCRVSGVAHLAGDDDIAVIQLAKELLSYLPQSAGVSVPRTCTDDPRDREDPVLNRLVPADPHIPYDMHHVLERLVDREEFLEIQPDFAPNMITAFGRVDGHSVAVIANQPQQLSGCIDIDAAVKASRFVRFADAFGLPIITLVDVPGFLPGTQQEHGGIIRHGAKLLYAYTEATVPKLTVIIRKAYGGAYCVMASKQLRGDLNAVWPNAQIAVMGAAAATQILHRNASEETSETQRRAYARDYLHALTALERGYVDCVVQPHKTRLWLANGLMLLQHKQREALREPWPPKKHDNMPL